MNEEHEIDRTLWCGNLHKSVTEDILYELMLQVGPVDSVKLIAGKDGGPNYAFITFKHIISVAFAKATMNGLCLYNKPMKLQIRSICKEKDPQTSESQLKSYLKWNEDLRMSYFSEQNKNNANRNVQSMSSHISPTPNQINGSNTSLINNNNFRYPLMMPNPTPWANPTSIQWTVPPQFHFNGSSFNYYANTFNKKN